MPPLTLPQARLGVGADMAGVQEDRARPSEDPAHPSSGAGVGATRTGSLVLPQTDQVLWAPLCCVAGFWPRTDHRAGGQ